MIFMFGSAKILVKINEKYTPYSDWVQLLSPMSSS